MQHLTLDEIKVLVLTLAKEKGFGTTPQDIHVGEKIALIHSEVSEAFEAYRHKNIDGKDGFKEELADIILRVLHLCAVFEIDIEQEILKKIKFNQNRIWDWKKLNEKRVD